MNEPLSERNYGWSVTFAAMGINLALGILYTWSVISKGIPAEWNWSQSDKSLPYAVACLIFSLVMIPAGRMQDKLSPRLVATLGGLLVGIGMIIASFTQSAVGYMVGFGIFAGAGIGFGYASATPPAVKWFPKAKTGMIAGIVVSGFGLALAYAAPLCGWMIDKYGLSLTVRYLGVAFLFVVCALAQVLKAPPAGYSAEKPVSPADAATASLQPRRKEDFTPMEMLKTPQFYMLWFMYACGAGAGLMVISVAKKVVDIHIPATLTLVALIGLALGNGGGRVIAGTLSDKLGRKATLFMYLVMQAGCIFFLSQAKEGSIFASAAVLVLLYALIGANYGANLALFPSFTKDYYGTANFGMNYGFVFTAWGIGGFMLAKLAGIIFDRTQSFNFAYFSSCGLLILAAVMVFLVKPPRHSAAVETAGKHAAPTLAHDQAVTQQAPASR